MFRARIQGWIKYYGAFYKLALYPTLQHLDRKLARWATRKFKRLRRSPTAGRAVVAPNRATSAWLVPALAFDPSGGWIGRAG
jgi:hypothetical protein